MRNMYANRVARGDSSTFLREKGRQSAMTASSWFKGSCNYYSTPGHKQAEWFQFLRESGGGRPHGATIDQARAMSSSCSV